MSLIKRQVMNTYWEVEV